MFATWRRRRGREREAAQQARFSLSRSRALEGMAKTYNTALQHEHILIEPHSYEYLGIIYRDLPFVTDATPPDGPEQTFFSPISPAEIPPLDMECETTKEGLEDILMMRSLQREHFAYQRLEPHTHNLVFQILTSFETLIRDDGSRKNRGLVWIADYVPCGNISPDFISYEFESVMWQSLWWQPHSVYRQREDLCLPHTVAMLRMAVEPDERLFKVEVLTALAIMLTRLQGEEFPDHNTVPVMIVSVMSRFQARILHLHYSRAGLVISKTGFMSFSTAESATLNMDTLMAMMSSKAIGDTKDPYNILKPISPTATPAESVTEPLEPRQEGSTKLHRIVVNVKHSVVRRPRRTTPDIASLFPADQPQSAPPFKDQNVTEQSPPGSQFAHPEQLFTYPGGVSSP